MTRELQSDIKLTQCVYADNVPFGAQFKQLLRYTEGGKSYKKAYTSAIRTWEFSTRVSVPVL
jgi:hypothetical protein